jgi:hypothetical protein
LQVKEEQGDSSEDELSQESADGEEVIMKIIDECQDEQGERPEEMEITDSAEIEDLIKEEHVTLKTDDSKEEKKDELGVTVEDNDFNMEVRKVLHNQIYQINDNIIRVLLLLSRYCIKQTTFIKQALSRIQCFH